MLQYHLHSSLQHTVAQLNRILKDEPALYELQFIQDGFEWVDLNHEQESVIAFKRKAIDPANDLLIVLNMTPVVRENWELEVKGKKYIKEIFNSNAKEFGGTGDVYNPEIISEILTDATDEEYYRLRLQLPPLAGIILK